MVQDIVNTSNTSVQLVWLKRDLRAHDHQPLSSASRAGMTVAVFIYEPEWWTSAEFSPCHLGFINESLKELEGELAGLGIPLITRKGSAVTVLRELHRELQFQGLWSHEETGCDWSYRRDRQVKTLCRELGVPWHEHRQFAVARPLESRDRWNRLREKTIERPLAAPIPAQSRTLTVRSEGFLDLPDEFKGLADKPLRQRGGRQEALRTLNSFLNERGRGFSGGISSPLSAESQGSRLSPYITYGNISLSEIHHALKSRRAEGLSTQWSRSLKSFESRLWWHCHFIQKLESEPEMEFHNVNRAFDGLRENEFREDLFEAWCEGQTGYPLVDACMRSLHATGWINFRMRAMLVSFASYHLWLHWRRPAQYLAQQFVDFEPGIHFSQFQMQSGVTGINAIRIYSPYKQSWDQDPDGLFIRRWIPELADVPGDLIHRPEQMPPLLRLSTPSDLGRYPSPIVVHEEAYAHAKQRIYSWKARPEVRRAAQQVYQKHGSRAHRHFPKQKRES